MKNSFYRLGYSFRIFYILSSLVPSNTCIYELKSRVNIRLHSSEVESFLFLKVANIYLIFDLSSKIRHLEIEPLKMSFCICVDSHVTVILILSYLSID